MPLPMVATALLAIWLLAVVLLLAAYTRWLQGPWLRYVPSAPRRRWRVLILPPIVGGGFLFGESPAMLRLEVGVLGVLTLLAVLVVIIVTILGLWFGATRFNPPPG
ncbi:MAG TPA: hypothetical protein VF134_04550 [Candidatus Dormibacteraeota bacterium]